MTNATAAAQTLNIQLDGATQVIPIIGSPIAQVRSPAGMTQEMQSHGYNAIIVPFHVQPADCEGFFDSASKMENVSGVIVTVPHKVMASGACARLTERAQLLGAVNVSRRDSDGSWYGDMCDGAAMVGPILANGCELNGKKALLVGAGGAGIAIAHSLLLSGVAELAVCELDRARFDVMAQRLSAWSDRIRRAERGDPTGFDVILNASPCGMRDTDPAPVEVDKLEPQMYVAEIITKPVVTKLLQAAAETGCRTQNGGDMFLEAQRLMARFLMGADDA